MSSPASEIVVSKEPPPSSPPQAMDKEPTPEPTPVQPSASPPVDPNSKKSFKRKQATAGFHSNCRYRKLLNRYLKIRATNQSLHSAYMKAITLASQLSNETANILDYLVGLNPGSPPASPPAEDSTDPPSPPRFDYDAHFGYSPDPSPQPEVANQLTAQQIKMGMIKVEPGSGATIPGAMGPPSSVIREDAEDTFKKPGGRRTSGSVQTPSSSRKRKDRESDGEEAIGVSVGRKKTKG